MDQTQGVYWHQGMFLQPQHFQIADRFNQFCQTPLFQIEGPHLWGVGRIEISRAAVNNQSMEITCAHLLFRDGHYVEFPSNAFIAPRTFNSAWIDGDKPLTVYLGVPKLKSQGRNVTEIEHISEAEAAKTRYVTLTNASELPDLYSDSPAAPVQTLVSVVKVFFESELAQLDGYELIPVARLRRSADQVVLCDRFVPPVYAMSGSVALQSMLRQIRDDLAGRARQLHEYKSPAEPGRSEFDASYIQFFLALRSLNRFAPKLFQLVETGHSHPWHAYGVLREIVGELSSFSERYNMLGECVVAGGFDLPPYDHSALEVCFGRARFIVAQLLNEISVGPEYVVELEPEQGMLKGELPQHLCNGQSVPILVVRTQTDATSMVDAVTNRARLAAESELPGLLRHALPGLHLAHMSVVPRGVRRRPFSYFFRIEQLDTLWEAVQREGRIALHLFDAPDDLSAEIIVLRK